MYNRLKTLTLLQLGNRINISKITNKKAFALNVFLLSLLCIAITVVFIFVLGFVKNTLFMPVNMGMLTFLLLISQGISIIVCVSTLMNNLYKSKDNSILLSYPAKHNEVFLSKLIVHYLHEIKKNIYFLLPLLVSFGIVIGEGVIFYLFIPFFFFLIPLLPVLIGALLSIPLMFIKRFLDHVPILYLFLIIGVVVLLFVGINAFVATIPQPLRIITMYYKFVNGITGFIMDANTYAFFYTFITHVMFNVNLWLNLLYIVLTTIGLIVLVYYISMPLYFTLACKSFENSIKPRKHKSSKKPKSTFFAFLRKELFFTTRNINTIINNYILVILMPIILFMFNVVFSSIFVSNLGTNMIISFNIMMMAILVLCSNTQSASAITVEGGEIALLKTAPSNTSNVVWAKLCVNVLLSTFLIFISCLILYLFFINIDWIKYIWVVFVAVSFLNFGHILWSLQIDVLNPQLREYNETGTLDNNPNVSMSMTLGLIIALVMGVVSLLLMYDNFSSGLIKIMIIPIAFFVLRLYFFITNLRVYFKRIEY